MPRVCTRRDLLKTLTTAGFGYLAFAGLATQAAKPVVEPSLKKSLLLPRQPHFKPRASRVIFLGMEGAPSHLDLFDDGSANKLLMKFDSNEGSSYVNGTSKGGNTFLLTANSDQNEAELYLSDGSDEATLKVDSDANEASLELNDSNCDGLYKSDQLSVSDNLAGVATLQVDSLDLTDGSGEHVTLDMPTDGSGTVVSAGWFEISICVDGSPMNIKVFATQPY